MIAKLVDGDLLVEFGRNHQYGGGSCKSSGGDAHRRHRGRDEIFTKSGGVLFLFEPVFHGAGLAFCVGANETDLEVEHQIQRVLQAASNDWRSRILCTRMLMVMHLDAGHGGRFCCCQVFHFNIHVPPVRVVRRQQPTSSGGKHQSLAATALRHSALETTK